MNENLKAYSDEELIAMFRAGDISAQDFLLDKYKALVKKKARLYYLDGGDYDDLLQEGMLGLFKAMSGYDPKKQASFATFANLCVNRQILSAVEAAGRKKHSILNESLSLDLADEKKEAANAAANPESIFMEYEANRELLEKIKAVLSPMEYRVFEMYMDGLNYRRIAEELSREAKSIDNALQRIRAKLKKIKAANRD